MSRSYYASDLSKQQIEDLIKHLVNWREKRHFHIESSILDDLYFEYAQGLVDGIYDILGYYKYDDEGDE